MTGFDFSQLQSEGNYMQLIWKAMTPLVLLIDGEGDNAIMNGEAEQFIGVASDREAPRLVEIADGDTRWTSAGMTTSRFHSVQATTRSRPKKTS